jgi:hypothetical protein
MPYLAYEETYAMTPIFLWQSLKPEPVYHHKVIRDYQTNYVLNLYLDQRSLSGFLTSIENKINMLWEFYVGPLLTVPLVMLPWVLTDRWMQFALITCSLLTGGLILETGGLSHYLAPITCLILVLILQTMRNLRVWRWRDLRSGLFLVRAITLLCVLSIVFPIGNRMGSWAHRTPVIEQLSHEDGRHLVIVRYNSAHFVHTEWVYNEADINAAKIVWAREMDDAHNRELIEYFKDRRIWLLQADKFPPKAVPFLKELD